MKTKIQKSSQGNVKLRAVLINRIQTTLIKRYNNMKFKLATILLSLFLIFATSCTVGTGIEKEPPVVKNIIFMIGDGMGLNQMYAAMTVNGGSLALESITHVGLQKNYSVDRYITDSGASATAMACGKKTYNGAIGVDSDYNELESVLKVAERNGLATGLVATSGITHATPAAFIANDTSRNNYEAIAADFLLTDIDLFIGGGLDHFSRRADGRDLTVELEANGYVVTRTVEELKGITDGKLAGFTASGANPKVLDGRGDMLPVSTKKAIELLSKNENGFFLMVEGSQIDWASHDNNSEGAIAETIDFDKAIKVALDFARSNGESLVVITGDHETGGMSISSGNFEKGTATLIYTTGGHTGVPIPVYSFGPYAELFTGIYENSGFKERFLKAWGIKQ
jgi:alkaline phosphatase